MNKTGSTQITTSSLTPSGPYTLTIKGVIETLINKGQDCPILWDKACSDYKTAPKQKLLWPIIVKEMNSAGG